MDEKLKLIQARLAQLGHDPGPIDGVWGTKTRDAIIRHLGLPVVAAELDAAPWLELARAQIGVREAPGIANDPRVIAYYRDAKVPQSDDRVPWCAAFVGAMLMRSGFKPSGSLMARSYLKWGELLSKPRRGAVAVFERGDAPSGHVAFIDDWSSTVLKCLGGNQGDAVSIASYAREGRAGRRLLGMRWPVERLAA